MIPFDGTCETFTLGCTDDIHIFTNGKKINQDLIAFVDLWIFNSEFT